MPGGVKSICTITDITCQTAPTAWASLTAIDLVDTQILYIASDSPSSQYRNKKDDFLGKQWAVNNKTEYARSLLKWVMARAV